MNINRCHVGLLSLVIGSIGLLWSVYTYPRLPMYMCTQIGYFGPPPGGFEIHSIGWDIVYTPDGVNHCRTPMYMVLIPAGLFGIGSLLLGAGLVTNDGVRAKSVSGIFSIILITLTVSAVVGTFGFGIGGASPGPLPMSAEFEINTTAENKTDYSGYNPSHSPNNQKEADLVNISYDGPVCIDAASLSISDGNSETIIWSDENSPYTTADMICYEDTFLLWMYPEDEIRVFIQLHGSDHPIGEYQHNSPKNSLNAGNLPVTWP